jgi:transcription-repair coupling factor (superfamily II helicase)
MESAALERAVLDFLRGSDQVLVSTTIIESGLDIPTANTLIVERADRLGLAQLYQIRGRVGRSRERAYAYLLYPSADALTHEAAARLSTLSDYTELGSGFKIAMRDLEIRGAGNLLGSEQSGHVAAVGFELYCRMLDEAVQAAGPEDTESVWEPVRLDVPVDAYVPAEYIPYEVAKIDLHRRIAAAREPADVEALAEEIEDRFGPLPEPVDALLKLQDARIKLGRAGARTAELRGDRLVIAPVELDSSQSGTLREQLDEVVYESLKRTLRIGMPEEDPDRLLAVLRAAEAVERVKSVLAEAA